MFFKLSLKRFFRVLLANILVLSPSIALYIIKDDSRLLFLSPFLSPFLNAIGKYVRSKYHKDILI